MFMAKLNYLMLADIYFYWQQVCAEIKNCNKNTHTYIPCQVMMIYFSLKLSEIMAENVIKS